MEVVQLSKRADGMIRATDEQKEAVLDLLLQGHSLSEVARAHGLAIQTLVKWRRGDVKRVMKLEKSPALQQPDDRKELLAEMRRLEDENAKLRKALGNVSYDRDILQEAYNIAVKKFGSSAITDCDTQVQDFACLQALEGLTQQSIPEQAISPSALQEG